MRYLETTLLAVPYWVVFSVGKIWGFSASFELSPVPTRQDGWNRKSSSIDNFPIKLSKILKENSTLIKRSATFPLSCVYLRK